MKTVEELAKEYQEGLTGHITRYESHGLEFPIRTHFIAGYNKAKEWISVKDDFPLGSSKKVLGKIKGEVMPELIWHNGNRFFGAETFKPYDNITHWKYID